MPRAIWSGAITFGLVNVPVRMYSAVKSKSLEFDLIHEKDGGRIGYQKYCKAENEPVPDSEIVKGYEVSKGEYVMLGDEDFAAAEAESFKAIEVEDFVPYDQIDPIFFEQTYYLGPQEGSEKVYALLVKALEQSGLVGIGRYVMRGREHIGCMRVREGVLTLERMYFADELRPVDEIAPADAKVGKRELEMATELIGRFTGEWEPEKYSDSYRERLLAVIEAKRKGETVEAAKPAEPEEPADLLEALRASLDATKGRRPSSAAKPRARRAAPKRDSTRTRKAASRR